LCVPAFEGNTKGVLGFLPTLSLLVLTVPGPDSVVIIANGQVTESMALAERYRTARSVPRSHLCALDLPMSHTISLESFRTRFLAPLQLCLQSGQLLDRIESYLLIKGVPLRVNIPVEGQSRSVSLAAALMVAGSSLSGGGDLLDDAPGKAYNCGGTACYGAQWANPFKTKLFSPNWETQSQGVHWRLKLVTMLNGHTYADAAKLIKSATTAESLGGAGGRFVFMRGGDSARARLDYQYDQVLDGLRERGFSDIETLDYDVNMTGQSIASFLVGTLSLQDTIEGNLFLPGSLVDNLTSFGAVPQNFEQQAENQVSIARWVAKGVAGVHGTTAEPLSNAFPDREFLLDYVDGMTLAEAFYRNMPFVYWRNLVLGDPMTAPYATRPEVKIEGLAESAPVEGSVRLLISASDPMFRGISTLKLFVEGQLLAESQGADLDLCVPVPSGAEVEVLAVAQVFGIGERFDQYLPKGWTLKRVRAVPGPSDCPEAMPDAAVGMDAIGGGPTSPLDAGFLDSGLRSVPAEETGACACQTAKRLVFVQGRFYGAWILFFALFFLRRRQVVDIA
jgi:uncharacterized protein (TIGR03790 family)